MIEKAKKHSPIPVSRLSRFFEFSSMTIGITGNIISSAASEYLKGNKPELKDLLKSNDNIDTFVKSVSKMRGAALKIGQLISLEAGDFLTKEALATLSLLRNDAYTMPPKQLKNILTQVYGKNFIRKFNYFDVNPIASASIGQVHKAETKDGKKIAIKIQYPGVKKSIKSDINNLSLLLKASRIIPPYIDIDSLLESAKKQLELETDYLREAKYQKLFFSSIKNDRNFKIPKIIDDFTTETSLAMDYIEGRPINNLKNENQNIKNETILKLIKLFFFELFQLKIMQTDPNYANFYIENKTQNIVLLDFGATTKIKKDTSKKFKKLLRSTFEGNKLVIGNDLKDLGIIGENVPEGISSIIIETFITLTEPIRKNKNFDFNSKEIQDCINRIKIIVEKEKHKLSLPDFEILLIQRKLGGIFLLAKNFKSNINLTKLLKEYV